VLRRWSLARDGDPEALTAMRTVISSLKKTRRLVLISYLYSLLARACLAVGDPRQGLEAVTTALADTQRTGARYMESELHRLHGELLAASGAGAADIEAAFGRAHEIACRQDAKALELRVAREFARSSPRR
jgi:hypothetical protein